MDENSFLEQLRFSELKTRYKAEKAESLAELEEEFQAAREGKRRDLVAGIEADRRHRQVLTLCVNPFVSESAAPYQLGYRFIHGSPLAELGDVNFDFLLANLSLDPPVAILGEAKGSVSSPVGVVNQCQDRKQAAEANLEYIKENYLRTDRNPRLEIVLAIPAVEATQVIDQIATRGGGVIPWMVDRGDNVVALDVSRQIDPAVRRSMLHGDNGLNDALRKVDSLERGFDIFPQSHPVTKLRMLAIASRREGLALLVSRRGLRLALAQDLFYLANGEVNSLADEIINLGTRIGALREEEGSLRIVSRWLDRGAVEEEIQKRWIEYRLDQELLQMREARTEEIQAKYLSELGRRPELGAFTSDTQDEQ